MPSYGINSKLAYIFLFTNLFAILSVRRTLFTYMLHCLVFLLLDCGGSVFGPCLEWLPSLIKLYFRYAYN